MMLAPVVRAADCTPDHFMREPAALQETHLSGFFGRIGRRRAEFLLPYLTCAIEFAVAVVA